MTPSRATMFVLALPIVAASVVGCGSSKTTSSTATTPPTTPAPTGASTTTPSSTTTSTGPATPAAPGQVTIVDYDFTPNTVTVKVGDTVTWTNQDVADHWVVSAPSSPSAFDLGRQTTGRSVSHTFTAPGSYPYFCNLHNYMKGMVVVQ